GTPLPDCNYRLRLERIILPALRPPGEHHRLHHRECQRAARQESRLLVPAWQPLPRRCPARSRQLRGNAAVTIRFQVDPRDVPPEKAARRLGLTLERFEDLLPRLLARGFPP